MEINDRLRILMDNFQLSSSQFADTLEIQRSAISHLLSGRNKPSILILEKIINKFPDVDIDWLITGKGNVLKLEKTIKQEESIITKEENPEINLFHQGDNQGNIDEMVPRVQEDEIIKTAKKDDSIEKIILIFRDKSFEILRPKTE